MREGLFLALVIVFSIAIGAVTNELGCGNGALSSPDNVSAPSGFVLFDIVDYIYQAISTYIAIISYQVDCINPLVATMLSATLAGTVVWIIIRLIRGGG